MLTRKHKHNASFIADNSPMSHDVSIPRLPICTPLRVSHMNIVNANSHDPPFSSVFDLPPPPTSNKKDTLPTPCSDPSIAPSSNRHSMVNNNGEKKENQFVKRKSQTHSGKHVLEIEIDDIDMNKCVKRSHYRSDSNAAFLELSHQQILDVLNDSMKPYFFIALLFAIFVILLVLYFIDKTYLFDGLVPVVISLFAIVIMCLILIYYRRLFLEQNDMISNISAETEKMISQKLNLKAENYDLLKDNEILTNSLNRNSNQLRKQNRTIVDLKSMIIANSATFDVITANKHSAHNSNSDSLGSSKLDKYSLLRGFRKGQMEIQIECAEVKDLINMLSVICSCITLLPFGMTATRKKLTRILERKINENAFLKMHFHFFLMSFYGSTGVKRLFQKHRIMKSVRETSQYYNYQWDTINEWKTQLRSRKTSVMSDATDARSEHSMAPLSPVINCEITDFQSYQPCNGIVHNEDDTADQLDQTVVFSEKDPIKLFRLPLDKCAGPGFRWVIPKRLQYRFFDPISGAANIQQLCVRKIFNSNARPYLIDCYVADEIASSFILKKGDDLRKDAAVLQMFAFMNEIWTENKLHYRGISVQSLNYRTYPIGPDIGIIELVPNCIELNKVLSLTTSLKDNKNVCNYNRLLASAAAAYICAFVMGIRDRHDDNILIETTNYNLFHIDFGYMFGDRVSLDTAKMAVTSDLKKIFDIYKHGWTDFIDISCKAWLLLRSNANELIDYARVVFAFLYETNEVEMFLRDSLKLDLSDELAQNYIYGKLKNAPKQWKTKIKNRVHALAQKIKSDNM